MPPPRIRLLFDTGSQAEPIAILLRVALSTSNQSDNAYDMETVEVRSVARFISSPCLEFGIMEIYPIGCGGFIINLSPAGGNLSRDRKSVV